MSSWIITCGCEASLTVDEIWPDGDAPENPTVADVIARVEESGSARSFARDWNMEPAGVEVNGRSTNLR